MRSPPILLGTWYTEGGNSQVRISKCGGALCGALVWLKEPNDENGRPKTDHENADASKRNRPLLGVQIVLGMKPSSTPNEWDGKVYNAKDGKTYTRLFHHDRREHRGAKGCVMVFCKSQSWTRAQMIAARQPSSPIARADRTARRAPSGRADRPPMPPRMRMANARLTAGRARIASYQRLRCGNSARSWPWRSASRTQPTQAMSAME